LRGDIRVKTLQMTDCTVNYNIRISDDSQTLSKEFCNELVNQINLLLKSKSNVNIALLGGNTPKAIFQEIVDLYKGKLNWKKINLFWGDERCVPPDDAESNYGMTKKYLLDHIHIPSENVYRIKGENDPQEEAKRYSDIIGGNLVSINNYPQFDVMLLGLGEDGHTVSIFPDQMELLESAKICEVARHPVTEQTRITVTGRVINNSKKIYFLVSGKSKSSVVGKILNETGDYLKLPGANIKPVGGELNWFLDKEAASEINSKK
jgi:6-phosphogluconolactonase